jgi:Helix-turn-helix.
MKIHEKIVRIRLYRNIKQSYMALKLAVSERTYRKYEHGQTRIPFEKLAKIAEILEVSTEDLMSEDERVVL